MGTITWDTRPGQASLHRQMKEWGPACYPACQVPPPPPPPPRPPSLSVCCHAGYSLSASIKPNIGPDRELKTSSFQKEYLQIILVFVKYNSTSHLKAATEQELQAQLTVTVVQESKHATHQSMLMVIPDCKFPKLQCKLCRSILGLPAQLSSHQVHISHRQR